MRARSSARLRRGAWTLGAVLVGAGLGFALSSRETDRPAYLHGARLIKETRSPRPEVAASRAYLVDEPVARILERLRTEVPSVIEGSTPTRRGIVFVVPREEGGRIRFNYPPAETLTVVPGPEGKGSVIQVQTFFRPNPLDGWLARVRRTLRI